jgi:predicted permease
LKGTALSLLDQVGYIFIQVLLPILLLVGLGALVQRSHPLDIMTLSKLQIYLFVPAFLFVRVFESRLTWGQMAGVAGAVLLGKVLMALPVWALLRRMQADAGTTAVVLMSGVIFNAGNFGIPVAERAYGPAGGEVQALVVMMSNLTLWGIGYGAMAAISGSGSRAALTGYFRLPMIYVLAAAFLLRALGVRPPGAGEDDNPVIYTLRLLAAGLVPLALITLGAQMAQQARWPRWRVVVPVLAIKLLLLPVAVAAAVWILGLWPWPGAMLIVAAAGPTAVNTLLMTVEQGGDIELAADCVFWTTLLSGITVTLVLAIVQALGGAPPISARP